MKNSLYFYLLTTFLFIFSINISAQTDSTIIKKKKTSKIKPIEEPRKLLLHKMDPNNFNFGVGVDMNFNLIGTQFGNQVGRAMPRFSVFFSKPINKYYINSFINMWDYSIEPLGITFINSRDKSSDNQYGSFYFEPSFLLQLIPERNNSDFKFLFGFRPSYLMYTYSEIYENGQYRISQSNVASNKNKVGDIDFSGLLGLSVKFSQIGNFDIKYIHSFTNKNASDYIQGRPSLLEFGIKLSAVQIGKALFDLDLEIQKEVIKFSQGTLLVMLPTPNKKAIKMLEESGRQSEINYIQAEQKITNELVINSFVNDYFFSNVLFFYDSSVNKVLTKDFSNVLFNKNNELIGFPEKLDSNNLFIASFCDDVSEYVNKFTYGLHVYDSKMRPLSKPFNTIKNDLGLFPGGDIVAYMRKKRLLYSKAEYSAVIKAFNNRLQKIKLRNVED